MDEQNKDDGQDLLAPQARPSLWREFKDFVVHHKAWWLVPIIVAALLLAGLVFLGSTGAAPFIYTLF